MKFNGSESRSAAEEFFEQLSDCRVEGHVSDQGLLSATSCAFKGEAARWFRMERERMRSWKKFAKMFKDRYVGELISRTFTMIYVGGRRVKAKRWRASCLISGTSCRVLRNRLA